MVLPIKRSIIYGPVNSRRLGKSLGINLTPQGRKYCDFDCLYCHYGRTRDHRPYGDEDGLFTGAGKILQEIEKALNSDIEFAYLTFSGNGEPTMHPQFDLIASESKKLVKRIRPEVKLTLLSNSSTCFLPKVIEAIKQIDLPIMKLDAGNEDLFREINNPVEGVEFKSILEGLRSLDRIVIQTLFLTGSPDNSKPSAVADWYDRLKEIRPVAVQIYTLDRPFAKKTEKGIVKIGKVDDARMEEIVAVGKSDYGLNITRY